MPISKFTYRKREFKDFKDVREALEEIAYQAEVGFRVLEKSIIPSSQILVQSSGVASSRTATQPISEETVNYRSGVATVSAGTNTITFTSNLPSNGYVVSWALFNSSNELSSATPDITTFTVSGFNITCLEAGVLHWRAEIPR